jgi:hypothetical protein
MGAAIGLGLGLGTVVAIGIVGYYLYKEHQKQ